MRSLVKIAVAGALLASGATAYADVALPSSGNGELVLFVRDLSNESRVYARGLGITIDQLLTAGQITGDPSKPNNADPVNNFADTNTLTYTLGGNISADGNLSSFLSSTANTTNYAWTIMAGDTTGGANLEGGRRYVYTSQVDFTTQVSTLTNGDLASGVYGNIEAMMSAVNGSLPDPAGSSTPAGADGWWGETGTSQVQAPNWFGAGPNNNNALGSAAHLYLAAGSGSPGAQALARLYKGVDFTLSLGGTLSSASVGGPQVPLPAAVWLLGSALVGLTGIARRRRQGEVVA
jgi:hypothetical protein